MNQHTPIVPWWRQAQLAPVTLLLAAVSGDLALERSPGWWIAFGLFGTFAAMQLKAFFSGHWDGLSIGWVRHGVCVPYDTYLRFEAELRRNRRMLNLLQDDEFAQQLSDVLAASTHTIFRRKTGEALDGSSDDFRALVAHYRNRGETYVDFLGGIVEYPMRPSIGREVDAELDRMGWVVARVAQRPEPS